MKAVLFSLALFSTLGLASHVAACGSGTDCDVDGGAYRIELPQAASGEKPGALIFFHGWQSTAAAQFKNSALVNGALSEGFAFVAPQGAEKTWSYPGSPSAHRDEFRFAEAVRRDLIENKGIDPDRIIVSGFSMGGSMAWSLACSHGDRYAGFVPIAGAFWEPLPEACENPTDAMIHVHGGSDRTVPMEGRPIGSSWRQGDVEASLAVLLGTPACVARPDFPAEETRVLTCQSLTCGSGMAELCMHSGGHSIRSEWVIDGLRRIAELKGWD
ncbi:MAG: alpha/beta hydrolase-fold protein [Pseudomonadota bacterium]